MVFEQIPEWSRAPKDIDKQVNFVKKNPQGLELLKMIDEKLQWMYNRDNRLSIQKGEFISLFGMFKYDVRMAIEAFGDLIMMDKEENILCSSMTMEEVNATIS